VFFAAGLCQQFCHGEDLNMFLWGSWTLFQVGSAIAEVGLVLYQLQNCFQPDHPAWNVALGTPIPVICGFFNYLKTTIIGVYRGVAGSNQDNKQ